MSDGFRRTVECTDAFDRPGDCTVVVRPRHVALTVPPGDAAQLTERQLSNLVTALNEARAELRRVEP